MEYYYTDKENVDLSRNILVIDDFEYKHLIKVLRKKTGDMITVTDGERNIYHCEISSTDKEKITCNILTKEYNLFEPEINLSLHISPLRNLSRFEFAIEKAVELGVVSVQPVITEHTISKNSISNTKSERLRKIIIGSMGQSQRCFLPELMDTISLNELIKKSEAFQNKIVMYESSDDNSEIKINGKDVSLLIGPEGGFSKEEINLLIRNNWQVKSLGKRKLRAETAAIVSIHNLISNKT